MRSVEFPIGLLIDSSDLCLDKVSGLEPGSKGSRRGNSGMFVDSRRVTYRQCLRYCCALHPTLVHKYVLLPGADPLLGRTSQGPRLDILVLRIAPGW